MPGLFFFLFFIMAGVFPCRSQNLSVEQKTFLHAMNRLVTTIPQNHWVYDEPMKVDSIFHFIGDSLSITWICNTNNSQIRTRLAAPFSGIKSIDWDYYLVLNCQDEKVVRVYEQTDPDPKWRLIEQTHLLHIGVVTGKNKKEMKMKEKIEKSFKGLKQHIKK